MELKNKWKGKRCWVINMTLPNDPEKHEAYLKRLSEAHKGLPSPRKGVHLSEETKQKIKIAKSDYHPSEETRKKQSIAVSGTNHPNYGKKLPEVTCKNISLGQKKRYENPDEHKKISDAHLGKTPSLETRNNMSLSQIRIWSDPIQRAKAIENAIGGFWYGNIRYYDGPQYCEKFNADLKERVRAYRGYVCFECGIPQNDRKMTVHHVHYNKKTCCDGSPHDLVPLCISCHGKTNINRNYWERHFTEMIYAIDPEGKCFFTKEEMKAYRVHAVYGTQKELETKTLLGE